MAGNGRWRFWWEDLGNIGKWRFWWLEHPQHGGINGKFICRFFFQPGSIKRGPLEDLDHGLHLWDELGIDSGCLDQHVWSSVFILHLCLVYDITIYPQICGIFSFPSISPISPHMEVFKVMRVPTVIIHFKKNFNKPSSYWGKPQILWCSNFFSTGYLSHWRSHRNLRSAKGAGLRLVHWEGTQQEVNITARWDLVAPVLRNHHEKRRFQWDTLGKSAMNGGHGWTWLNFDRMPLFQNESVWLPCRRLDRKIPLFFSSSYWGTPNDQLDPPSHAIRWLGDRPQVAAEILTAASLQALNSPMEPERLAEKYGSVNGRWIMNGIPKWLSYG